MFICAWAKSLNVPSYSELVEKTKKTLNNWHNRNLTLIGKIQVVNTLIASLFVYKMTVLPFMPEKVIKNIDNLIRNYIWNRKKSKIAYKILQLPKKEGGLNLVNLRVKDKAIKATWPQILEQEEEYAQLVYQIMRCTLIQSDIWRCQLHQNDVTTLGIKNKFWEDVLTAWCEFNFYKEHRIENQILWYNSQIKIKGKCIMWNDTSKKGLKYVYQLFENQKFKEHDQVWEEYGLTKLRYNSLKVAIPKEWKEFFTNNPTSTYCPIPPHNYDTCIQDKSTSLSQKVYKFLSDDAMLIHNKYIKWRQELGEEYDL